MLRLINSTPFETNITLHGSLRIKQSPNDIHIKLNNLPPWQKWFTEWFYILKDGPIYKQIDYCIDPWTTYECITSPIDNEMTEIVMGFNDVRTQWTRHTPGIFHWDNKFAEVNISCKPVVTISLGTLIFFIPFITRSIIFLNAVILYKEHSI